MATLKPRSNNLFVADEMLSISAAASRGIIKRGTAIELLEAQAATGNLIDPKTAKKMSVEMAYRTGEL